MFSVGVAATAAVEAAVGGGERTAGLSVETSRGRRFWDQTFFD